MFSAEGLFCRETGLARVNILYLRVFEGVEFVVIFVATEEAEHK